MQLGQKPFKVTAGKAQHFTTDEKLNELGINISYTAFKGISAHIKNSLNNWDN